MSPFQNDGDPELQLARQAEDSIFSPSWRQSRNDEERTPFFQILKANENQDLPACNHRTFAGFALFYVYALKGEPLECGCFGGIIASQLGVSTALRNLALIIPAIIVWFGYSRKVLVKQTPVINPVTV